MFEDPADPSVHEPDDDPLYPMAVKVCTAKRDRITFATLQRTLMIGFNRASRLMEVMQARGLLECVPTSSGGHFRLTRKAPKGGA